MALFPFSPIALYNNLNPKNLQSKSKAVGSMKRMRRNLLFLKSVLNEANRYRRQELLQHANSDQINTMNEMAMNVLKNNIPIPAPLMVRLKRHKKVL